MTSSGRAELLPRLLGVLLDEVDDRRARARARAAPRPGASRQRQVELAARALAAHALGVLDEPLGRVGAAVEDDVLDALEQLRLDVLVDGELAGVDDAHVEAGA